MSMQFSVLSLGILITMEKNFNLLSELKNEVAENAKKLNARISKIMDIKTFEEGILKGLYSDAKGTAYLILNGTLYNSYNIYIDRRCITKSGSIVSFESLLKTYAPEEIQIRYDLKEQKLPSLELYRSLK